MREISERAEAIWMSALLSRTAPSTVSRLTSSSSTPTCCRSTTRTAVTLAAKGAYTAFSCCARRIAGALTSYEIGTSHTKAARIAPTRASGRQAA